MLDNSKDCFYQNFDIQTNGPVFYVFGIQSYNFLKVRNITSSTYLPHAGDSWLGGHTASMMKFVLLPFIYCRRAGSSSCQDRNNFFLKKICNTMNYRITHKNGAKKELLFSQKPFHINYLLFYYFLKNLPIQQIILFSYTFKNQFLGSHIKFYRLYSLIRIIT